MAVGRLGTKRQCLACGAKFYDLGRRPPTCSRCGAKVEPKKVEPPAGPQPAKGTGAVEPTVRSSASSPKPAPPPQTPSPGAFRGPAQGKAGPAPVDARAGRGDRRGRPMAEAGRAAGLPPVRLRRRRQDDARPPRRGGRGRGDGVRRLHRQGGDGHARARLPGRDHHPRADLPGERGRRRRADLHPQRGRPRLAGEPDRDRRVLDGRRRARARPPVFRQAHSGARRPVPASTRQGRRLFHRTPRPT